MWAFLVWSALAVWGVVHCTAKLGRGEGDGYTLAGLIISVTWIVVFAVLFSSD